MTFSPARPSPIHGTLGRPDQPARIHFALKAHERRMFFNGSDDKCTPPGMEYIWAADTELAGENWRSWLDAWKPEIVVTGWSTPALPADWLDSPSCPLRYVCHITGSVRKLLPRRFIERGGVVTNWGGLAAPTVAEHALLLALAALRNLPGWRPAIERGRGSKTKLGTRSLFGRRVGVHGFGQVGRALLALLKPFDVQVAAYSQGLPEDLIRAAGVEPCASLNELFSRSEVLFECEALTPATRASVNAEVLAALPEGAIFVNVGRGPVVDEAALVQASLEGHIRLALDVSAQDPLTITSPLWDLPDAVLSPHIAGPTMDHYPRCAELAQENLRAFLNCEPLQAVVTPEIYDRST